MPRVVFSLRFPAARIEHWAGHYPSAADDAVHRIAAAARKRGFLTKAEFMAVGDWKTPRSRKHRASNSDDLVRETTRVALTTKNDELKIGVLRVLAGVEWPTASAILHLCDRGKYPILDVRALWSAGLSHPLPPFSFELWGEYTRFTRQLSRNAGCTMREVDRALWQYSKEHEPDARA